MKQSLTLQRDIIPLLSTSAYDPNPLDPQDFGFLDQDPQKSPDPRGKNIKQKLRGKNGYSLNLNLNF